MQDSRKQYSGDCISKSYLIGETLQLKYLLVSHPGIKIIFKGNYVSGQNESNYFLNVLSSGIFTHFWHKKQLRIFSQINRLKLTLSWSKVLNLNLQNLEGCCNEENIIEPLLS